MISMKTYTHAMRSDEDSLRRLVSTCQPRRGHTSVTAGWRPADRRVLHLSLSPRGSHLTLLILHILQITRHIPLPAPCSLLIACCSEMRPLRISSTLRLSPESLSSVYFLNRPCARYHPSICTTVSSASDGPQGGYAVIAGNGGSGICMPKETDHRLLLAQQGTFVSFTCRPVVLHSFCFQVPTYTLFYPILPYSLSVNDCCQ